MPLFCYFIATMLYKGVKVLKKKPLLFGFCKRNQRCRVLRIMRERWAMIHHLQKWLKKVVEFLTLFESRKKKKGIFCPFPEKTRQNFWNFLESYFKKKKKRKENNRHVECHHPLTSSWHYQALCQTLPLPILKRQTFFISGQAFLICCDFFSL